MATMITARQFLHHMLKTAGMPVTGRGAMVGARQPIMRNSIQPTQPGRPAPGGTPVAQALKQMGHMAPPKRTPVVPPIPAKAGPTGTSMVAPAVATAAAGGAGIAAHNALNPGQPSVTPAQEPPAPAQAGEAPPAPAAAPVQAGEPAGAGALASLNQPGASKQMP